MARMTKAEKRRIERKARRGELKAELYADSDLRAAFKLRKSSAFVMDVFRKRIWFGDLSEKQIAALKKFAVNSAKIAERKKADAELLKTAPVITNGRYPVEGTVVSTKMKWTPYGDTRKMLVKSDSGNKLWGTVPSAVIDLERGDRIRFVATIKKSDNDDHFGFFSRPAKAEIVNTNLDKAA